MLEMVRFPSSLKRNNILPYVFFIHSLVDGQVCCFCILVIVNNGAINMRVQALL